MTWCWDSDDERWVWAVEDGFLVAANPEEQDRFDNLCLQGRPLLLTSEGVAVACERRKVGFK